MPASGDSFKLLAYFCKLTELLLQNDINIIKASAKSTSE